jgi:hypothetical protein
VGLAKPGGGASTIGFLPENGLLEVKNPTKVVARGDGGISEIRASRGLHHLLPLIRLFLTKKVLRRENTSPSLIFPLYNFSRFKLEKMEKVDKASNDGGYRNLIAGAKVVTRWTKRAPKRPQISSLMRLLDTDASGWNFPANQLGVNP